MQIAKNIFFLVFITAFLMTTLHSSFLPLDEMADIQLVEEGKEVADEAENYDFSLGIEKLNTVVSQLDNYLASHFFALHFNDNYRQVYIAVPYSPPELI